MVTVELIKFPPGAFSPPFLREAFETFTIRSLRHTKPTFSERPIVLVVQRHLVFKKKKRGARLEEYTAEDCVEREIKAMIKWVTSWQLPLRWKINPHNF